MANQERKIYNIRWKQSDYDDLRKAVRNFNDKIRRLEKKYPEIKSALPQRASYNNLKNIIASRDDLERELRALRAFSGKRTKIELKKDYLKRPEKYAGKSKYEKYTGITRVPIAEDNIYFTKWQKSQMVRRSKRVSEKRFERYKEIKDLPVTQARKPVGYNYAQKVEYVGMDDADKQIFSPAEPFYKSMNYASLDKGYQWLLEESQDHYWDKREEILKENVINTIKEEFNKPESQDDIDAVVKAIEEMEFKDFYKIFKQENGKFTNFYRPNDEQYNAYVANLITTWIPTPKPANIQ